MSRVTNNEIMKNHLVICEGRDEQEFLIRYLNSPALSNIPGFSNDIQVMDFGGNSELYQYLEILQLTSNFDTVKSLSIIRDAESNAETAISEIKYALEKARLPVPQEPHLREGKLLKVGFVLFPSCDYIATDGTLEDLCLSILAEPQASNILQEIDSFLTLLKNDYGMEFSRIFKTRLHTYFSTHNDYVSLKIGEAARAGAFDWNSAALKPLKDFLQEIL